MTRLLAAAGAGIAVVLAPWALVIAVVAGALYPDPVEAAPRVDRFVQHHGATSIGIGATGRRLACVSAVVTGKAAATVSVTVGRHPVWTARRVPARTETGCAGTPYPLDVGAARTPVVVRIGSAIHRLTLR